MSKLRQHTLSGENGAVTASRSRPHKPTNDAIDERRSAAKARGGNALTPKRRKALEREGMRMRTNVAGGGGTRAGKRSPEHGRHVRGAAQRAARPSRKANVPASDRRARAVPGTRITRNEPKA